MLVVVSILAIVLLVLTLLFFNMYKEQKRSVERSIILQEEYRQLILEEKDKVNSIGAKLKKEVSRNKSVEVRTGHIIEKAAPFLDVFGHDPRQAQFLGNPIDYIVFGDDQIVFVEVKSGKSRLSQKQKKIRDLVQERKVSFQTVRIDYDD